MMALRPVKGSSPAWHCILLEAAAAAAAATAVAPGPPAGAGCCLYMPTSTEAVEDGG